MGIKDGFLRRNLKSCPQQLKEQAYISLVRSVVEYASVTWSPHKEKDIKPIQRIQKRATRFVMHNYSKDGSVSQMFYPSWVRPN